MATSLANNAKVLDACQNGKGDCGNAIQQAERDRTDLQQYEAALTQQQGEATDPAARDAIAAQIKQAEGQIRSADNAIAEGKLIHAGGDYSLAGLTTDERMAIGFALDPLGAATSRIRISATSAGIPRSLPTQVFEEPSAAVKAAPRIPPTLQEFTNSPQNPVIPFDWVSRPGRTEGSVIYFPPGTNPSLPGSTHIRVMPSGSTSIPGLESGYWVYTRDGQPINPSTNTPGGRGESHIPLPQKYQ
jgi:hypothetical protein